VVYGTSSTTSSTNFFAYQTYTFRTYAAPRPVHRCLHYLFGVPCNVSKMELRRAYRRLAKIAHPDMNPGMGRWMTILNRAYEALEAA
jgi:DnaJ-class molecular chaperone